MKKYTLVLVSILLSGCSNFERSDYEKSVVEQEEVNQICKKIVRHKSLISRCRPVVEDNLVLKN